MIPDEIKAVRGAAERLYDWTLPSGHPDRGIYGINPWRLDDQYIAYAERDKAILLLARFALAETRRVEELEAGIVKALKDHESEEECFKAGCGCTMATVDELLATHYEHKVRLINRSA